MSDRYLEFMSQRKTWLLPVPNRMLPFTSNLNRNIVSDHPVAQSSNLGSNLDSLFLTGPTSNPLAKLVSITFTAVLKPVYVSSVAPTPPSVFRFSPLERGGTSPLVSLLPLLFLYYPSSSLLSNRSHTEFFKDVYPSHHFLRFLQRIFRTRGTNPEASVGSRLQAPGTSGSGCL